MSVLAVGGYLVTNWAFRVTRRPPGPGGDWHLSRGLFTTRETTLDDDRVAGVIVTEAIGVRAARGARLGAIVTGLDRSDRGSSTLVPPAPRATVERAARAVLGADAPGDRSAGGARPRRRTPPLDPRPGARRPPRGRRGRRRRPRRPGLAAGRRCWSFPVAALLAADRARSLGHALVDRHVVARAGSVVRRRRALEVGHVIGWNFSATWFQRRAGLTTLVATTAGGGQAVPIPDIPEDLAVALAEQALPDLVSQFRA